MIYKHKTYRGLTPQLIITDQNEVKLSYLFTEVRFLKIR